MPLNDPDCGCPYPYRVQVGNPTLGREVKYYVCCAVTAIEKLTGQTFHQVMYDIEPGEAPPDSGPQRPPGYWHYFRRIVEEKRAKGFKMEGL